MKKTIAIMAAAATLAATPVLYASQANAQQLLRLGIGAAAVGAGATVGANLANRVMNRPRPGQVIVQQPTTTYVQQQPVVVQQAPVVVQGGFSQAHYQYCFSRYRSYDAASNTYQPYNGPRRPCYSPY